MNHAPLSLWRLETMDYDQHWLWVRGPDNWMLFQLESVDKVASGSTNPHMSTLFPLQHCPDYVRLLSGQPETAPINTITFPTTGYCARVDDELVRRWQQSDTAVVHLGYGSPGAESAIEELNNLFYSLRGARFPEKLWRLANCRHFGAIEWAANGRELIINVRQLKPYLKKISRTGNIKSFVRMLHLYQFRKTIKFSTLIRRGLQFDPNLLNFRCNGFCRDVPIEVATAQCQKRKR